MIIRQYILYKTEDLLLLYPVNNLRSEGEIEL